MFDSIFWKFLNRDRKDIFAIYFCAIMDGLVQLSVPLGIQSIIGFVLGSKMVVSIYLLIILVCIGVFMAGFLQITQMKIIETIKQKIFTRVAFEFSEKIPDYDLYKTDEYYLPEKINRFFDTLNLQKGISKILLEIPTAIMQIFLGVILLSFYNVLFLTTSIILLLIIGTVIFITGKKGIKTSLEESNQKYKVASWLQEIAKNVKNFKFYRTYKLETKITDQYVYNYLKAKTAHFKILLFQYKTIILYKVLITAFLLSIGVYLLMSQKLNIGEFIATEIVILMIMSSVEKMIKNLDSFYDIKTALKKINEVTELPSEDFGNYENKKQNYEIALSDFSFAYPNQKNLFTNINLNFPPNSITCIMGAENTGKTTLLQILSTFYFEYTGNILINDIPLKNYNLKTLRDKIKYSIKKFESFSGNIYENISMGDSTIPEQKIIQTADELGFHDIFKNLPYGFQTNMDIHGNRLPKNVITKIALLKTLIHNQAILILEDPWKNLEPHYKDHIAAYLLKKSKSNTVIVSTNDRDFAMKCDQVIELTTKGINIIK